MTTIYLPQLSLYVFTTKVELLFFALLSGKIAFKVYSRNYCSFTTNRLRGCLYGKRGSSFAGLARLTRSRVTAFFYQIFICVYMARRASSFAEISLLYTGISANELEIFSYKRNKVSQLGKRAGLVFKLHVFNDNVDKCYDVI